jgi:CubicO group peptidase (beta-lactamase class C family)
MSDPGTTDARLAAALWETGGWDATNIAAAVVGPDGTLATIGPGERSFRLASVTKLLAAYACLIAMEEGTLDLDEPTGPPGVTVRHLLAHAGGYGFDTGVLQLPERKRIYSNTGFEALADHLAHNAAMPAADYVQLAVFEPLGMVGSDLRGGSLAHGAWSTGADLARFARELLRPTLIHPDTLAAATAVTYPGLAGILPGVGPQEHNDWGLGFEIRGHKSPHWTGRTNSPATFGHFGASGCFLWVDPAISTSLLVLTDRNFGPWALDAWPPLADAVVAATSS